MHRSHANSNNFTSSPANDFFFLTEHSLHFPSCPSPPSVGGGAQEPLTLLGALLREEQREAILFLLTGSLCGCQHPLHVWRICCRKIHLEKSEVVGGGLKSNLISPCRTSRRCRCVCFGRPAGSVFRWMTRARRP